MQRQKIIFKSNLNINRDLILIMNGLSKKTSCDLACRDVSVVLPYRVVPLFSAQLALNFRNLYKAKNIRKREKLGHEESIASRLVRTFRYFSNPETKSSQTLEQPCHNF